MSEGIRSVTPESTEAPSDFPLAHPARVPMPIELRSPGNRGELPRASGVAAGVAVALVEREPVAAWAARTVRNGHGAEMMERLRQARRAVERGATLREVVVDGTLPGWRLRLALSEIAGEALVNWDGRKGRTPVERLAVVRRAIDELMDAQSVEVAR